MLSNNQQGSMILASHAFWARQFWRGNCLHSILTNSNNIFDEQHHFSQQYNIFDPSKLKDGKLYKYDYKELHADLEKQHFAGVYGWDNACYWGIAEVFKLYIIICLLIDTISILYRQRPRQT